MLRTILSLEDTPHQIALGAAIGMFVAMTPTVGMQMILVMLVAFLTRPFLHFNRAAALVMVYVSNPVTMVPLYWFNYKIGTLFFVDSALSWQYFSQMRELTWVDTVIRIFVEIGAPLIAGSLIVATVSGILAYPFIRWLLHSVSHMDMGLPSVAETAADETEEPVSTAAD